MMTILQKNTWLRVLRIKHNEMYAVFWCCLFTFFVGGAQNFLLTVPISLFLSHFKTDLLPYIYMGTAAFTLITGRIFDYYESRTSLVKLLSAVLLLLASILIIFWILLEGSTNKYIAIGLVASSGLGYSFGNLTVACLVSQIFTLQQGKRIFGVLSASQGIGIITTGFITPIAALFISVNHIILVTAAMFISAFLVLIKIASINRHRFHSNHSDHAHSEEETPKKMTMVQALKNRYILLVFMTIMLVMFEYNTLDVLFNVQLKQYLVNEQKIASFLGIFFAVCGGFSIFIGAWGLSRSFEKIGLISTLLILPTTLLSLLIIISMLNLFPFYAILIFGIIIFARLFNEMIATTGTEQGILLLFQPLHPTVRTWISSQSDTTIAPLATGIIGIIMVGITNLFGLTVTSLSMMLLLICSSEVIVMTILRKEYFRALMKALAKRELFNTTHQMTDKENINLLKNYLNSSYSSEVIYALNTLENINTKMFTQILLEKIDTFLNEKESQIIFFVLEKINQYKIKEASEKIKLLMGKTTNKKILALSLVTLQKLNGLSPELFTEYFNKITSTPSKALPHANKKILTNFMALLSESTDPQDRVMAAYLLQYMHDGQNDAMLEKLLLDTNSDVRIAACDGIHSIINENLYPILIQNCILPNISDYAREALAHQAKHLITFLKSHFNDYTDEQKYSLIRTISILPLPDTQEFLLHHFSSDNQNLYSKILQTLNLKQYQAKTSHYLSLVSQRLENETCSIAQLKKTEETLAKYEGTSLIQGFIKREIELSQHRIFLLLSFSYPYTAITTAKNGFESPEADTKSYAIEILSEILTPLDRQTILSVLTEESIHASDSHISQNELITILKMILENRRHYYISAISAAIVYTIGLLKFQEFIPEINQLELSNDPILKETYDWALQQK